MCPLLMADSRMYGDFLGTLNLFVLTFTWLASEELASGPLMDVHHWFTSLLSSVRSAPAEVPGIRHPYYPRDILLPGCQPLVLPYEVILAAFFGAAAVITACVWGASGTPPFCLLRYSEN